MKARVIVTPKAAVLDPQGAAVKEAMQHLGMPEVQHVRIGKYMEIEVKSDGAELESRMHAMCRDLLSNPVIEDYRLELEQTKGDAGSVPYKTSPPAHGKLTASPTDKTR